MRAIIVRHHEQNSPGYIAEALQSRGAEIATHSFPADGSLPPFDGADLLVVLGAITSVYDDGPASSWIAEELTWLQRADEAGVPVLGICFGAQALCIALGGRVVPAERKEVGWTLIDSVDPDAIPAGPWLQFHKDRCIPPERAVILASNDVGVQAFTAGRHLAVQFHPEVDGRQLKLWIEAFGPEMETAGGPDLGSFLVQTIAEEPAARRRADLLVATALRLAQVAPAVLLGHSHEHDR